RSPSGKADEAGRLSCKSLSRQPEPIHDAQTLPAFDFLARHYTICDSWFAPLPSGTQPNRLMAMAGESAISDNVQGLKFIPDQALVYDWLRERGIPWCVYQSGSFFPFFSLMKKWLPEIITSLTLPHDDVGGSFRRYTRFAADWQSNAIMPKVIFIEPEYTDGPNCNPNDDHSPTGVAPGQAFVADVYRTLTSNADRWRNTLLIVTYDEHGGFFDHVSPLRLPDNVAGFAFETTGLRVPAILVSPYVSAGGVFSGNLDHTSILQLLAEKFDSNRIYSAAVSARNEYLDRLSGALNTSATAVPPPALAGGDNASFKAPFNGELNAGQSEVNQGFHAVALQIARDHPQVLTSPQWTNLAQYISTFGKH
ncbi:phospholipase, partial [Paraburkholderia sp. UYCP14C]|uniref:alkaline phosphatase family protein n=1 Tax=Paraburkholderia sp. UYCP14C TaxID=2511130 RepID=UPI0010D298DC